jgi:hypothetical protein
MPFIPAVGGTDHEQITNRQDVAVAGFVWKDTQGRHVQLPDDVCRTLVVPLEAAELALGGDVAQPVAFNIRSTCRRRQQPVPQTVLQPRSHILPKERAIRRPKRLEHA